jgi:hypothetical protein
MTLLPVLVIPAPDRIAKPAKVPSAGAWAWPGALDAIIIRPSIANAAINREQYRVGTNRL